MICPGRPSAPASAAAVGTIYGQLPPFSSRYAIITTVRSPTLSASRSCQTTIPWPIGPRSAPHQWPHTKVNSNPVTVPQFSLYPSFVTLPEGVYWWRTVLGWRFPNFHNSRPAWLWSRNRWRGQDHRWGGSGFGVQGHQQLHTIRHLCRGQPKSRDLISKSVPVPWPHL